MESYDSDTDNKIDPVISLIIETVEWNRYVWDPKDNKRYNKTCK